MSYAHRAREFFFSGHCVTGHSADVQQDTSRPEIQQHLGVIVQIRNRLFL